MPRTDPSSRRWVAVVWLALWALLAAVLVPHNVDPMQTQWTRFSSFDYRDTVWMPLRDFWYGGTPWDTPAYLERHPGIQFYPAYLPHYWWVVWPFAALPYQLSVGLWLGVTTLSLVWLNHVGLSWAIPQHYRRAPWLLCATTAFFLATRPVRAALFQGQLALPCAVGAVLALSALGPKMTMSGSLMALAKPPVGLPLILLQLALRRSRAALAGIGIAAALSLPVLLVLAARNGGLLSAVRILAGSLAQGSNGANGSSPNYIDLHGLVGHLTSGPAVVWQVAALTLACLLTLPATAAAHRRFGPRNCFYLAATELGMVIIAPTMLYGLVVAIPALICLVGTALEKAEAMRTRVLASITALLIGLPMMAPEDLYGLLGLSPRTALVLIGLCLAAAALTTTTAAFTHQPDPSPQQGRQ